MRSKNNVPKHLEALCIKAEQAYAVDWNIYFQLMEEAIVLAQQLSHSDKLFELLIKRAETYARQNKYESSESDLDIAQQILMTLSEESRSQNGPIILKWRGNLASLKGSPEKALGYYKQALEIACSVGGYEVESSIRYNLGSLYCQQFGDFDSSYAQYKHVLQSPLTHPVTRNRCLMQLAYQCSHYYKDVSSAKGYLEQIDKGRLNLSDQMILNLRLGEISFIDAKYEEALSYYKNATDQAVKLGDRRQLFHALNGSIPVLDATGKEEELIQQLTKVFRIVQSSEEYCYAHANFAMFYASKIESNDSNDEILNKCNYHLSASESYSRHLPVDWLIPYLERLFEIRSKLKDYPNAVQVAKQANELRLRYWNTKVHNDIASLRLLMKIEREEHAKQIEQMKRQQTEKELATASVHLALQTELLGNFRNDLRQIVREVDEPIAALKKIKEKLKELPCEQIDWVKFEKQFTDVHPEFKSKLLELYPDLTKQEVKMCQLARLGLKSIEMAQLLCLSERSVESHRYTLRKKLGIPTEQNLTEFLSTIKL